VYRRGDSLRQQIKTVGALAGGQAGNRLEVAHAAAATHAGFPHHALQLEHIPGTRFEKEVGQF
jgi:hypothetical protein